MNETVKCPHCNFENDMKDALTDGLSSDNTTDWECQNRLCEEEFEVAVDFIPTYAASKIEYNSCEKCQKETREIRMKGKVFPWPKDLAESKLCDGCYARAYFDEMKEVKI